MLSLVLANHLVGLLLFRQFTSDEVEVNKAMIVADGAADTLGAGFHSRRTVVRFWAWLGCSLLGAVPAAAFVGWAATAWSFAALGVLLAGYFLRTFSPSLNAALGLAWKARFYVSYSTTASLLDRAVWALSDTKLGRWLVKEPERKQRANKLFQYGLNVCLVLTLLVYVALLVPLARGNW